MKIRSITAFTNLGWPLDKGELDKAAAMTERARAAFKVEGYEVQTTRLASRPFPIWLLSAMEQAAVEQAQATEEAVLRSGFGYLSLGPALLDRPESYALIPAMMAATKNSFFSGILADRDTGISMKAVKACAAVIHRAARLEENGFANLRFAALANVPPGSPFFPAAYHGGGKPAFAIATEAADLAVKAYSGARDLEAGSEKLRVAIEQHGKRLAAISEDLARGSEFRFGGIDFSLAPFPEESASLGAAFERMGVPAVGMHGSLAAAAILADTIDRAEFPRTGFSGLLLPPLEDAILARRTAEGFLSANELLMCSAVCGTGLDTLPLPGDSSEDELAAILLDVAALALRLDKPLTARLMPIPGKKAGDVTSFEFDYFANSRVMDLKASKLGEVFQNSERIVIKPRPTGRK
jgi:hypothetical protein